MEPERSTSEEVTCSTCRANCCRLEVMLVTDTGVPERFVEFDKWGGMTMARLEDGWCAALDRETLLCTIYDRRPLICREFEMGGRDCLAERPELRLHVEREPGARNDRVGVPDRDLAEDASGIVDIEPGSSSPSSVWSTRFPGEPPGTARARRRPSDR